jgi:nucleotide-binding universal stress UspA family protein
MKAAAQPRDRLPHSAFLLLRHRIERGEADAFDAVESEHRRDEIERASRVSSADEPLRHDAGGDLAKAAIRRFLDGRKLARFVKSLGRMNLPKNILVPTDFSQGAEAALEYAVALAAKLDAKVHLLHVVGLQMLSAETGMVLSASIVDEIFKDNQKELDRLVAARQGQCGFGATLLESGDARGVIQVVANNLKADLIVMGTHGRRGFKRLLLGSVAETLVRIAPCPVLLVRTEPS